MKQDNCCELLPWYVNETLDATQRAQVEQHLGECEACREEIGELRALQETVVEGPQPTSIFPANFDEVVERIEADKQRRRTPVWVRVLVAGQAAAILALLMAVGWPALSGPAPQEFRTLSDPVAAAPADEPRLRVVFADSATAGELRELLRTVGAEIAAGPSSVGAYTVRLVNGNVEAVGESVSVLRANANVRLVEFAAR